MINVLGDYCNPKVFFRNNFLKHLFVIFLSNFSTTLLLNVDGVVVSHLIGENALNSVSLLNPMTSFIGAISVFLTVGFSSVLSKTYGSEEKRKTEKVFRASFILLVIFVVLIYVIQIPIAYIIIGNYAVDSEIKSMIWAYAMGVMISSGFGLINSLCCYLFIASGEGKIILKLSLLESIINLIGDIIFIKYFNLGVLGAGLGTTVACIIRSFISMIIVQKKYKIFPLIKVGCSNEMKEILKFGSTSGFSLIFSSLQVYILNNLISIYCGMDGITVLSVATMAGSFIMLLSNSFIQTENSFLGILVGVEDWESAFSLHFKVMITNFILVLSILLFIFIKPEALFFIYGINSYDNFELVAIKIYLLQYLFKTSNNLFRKICIYCNKNKLSVISVVFENYLLLVPVAIVLCTLYDYGIFCAYSVTSFIVFVVLLSNVYIIYKNIITKEQNFKSIHFRFESSSSIKLSNKLLYYFKNNNLMSNKIYKLCLAIEELAYYSTSKNKNKNPNIFIYVKMYADYLIFFYLDDGIPTIFNKELKATDLVIDNYNLIKKLSNEFRYQIINGFNNFIIKFVN